MTAAVQSTFGGLRWFRRGRGRCVIYDVCNGDPGGHLRSTAYVEAIGAGYWRATVRLSGVTKILRSRRAGMEFVVATLAELSWKQPPLALEE